MPFDIRLPETLVARAAFELEQWGIIFSDTAALLIEAGADMFRLEDDVRKATVEGVA
jgi:hypothetical protein